MRCALLVQWLQWCWPGPCQRWVAACGLVLGGDPPALEVVCCFVSRLVMWHLWCCCTDILREGQTVRLCLAQNTGKASDWWRDVTGKTETTFQLETLNRPRNLQWVFTLSPFRQLDLLILTSELVQTSPREPSIRAPCLPASTRWMPARPEPLLKLCLGPEGQHGVREQCLPPLAPWSTSSLATRPWRSSRRFCCLPRALLLTRQPLLTMVPPWSWFTERFLRLFPDKIEHVLGNDVGRARSSPHWKRWS